MKTALRAALLSDVGLYALIEENLYNGHAPQQTEAPYITSFTVSSGDKYDHGGSSSVSRMRVQFNMHGNTADDVGTIRDALVAAVNTNVMGKTVGGVVFGLCPRQTDVDVFNSNIKTYRRVVDFIFNYTLAP